MAASPHGCFTHTQPWSSPARRWFLPRQLALAVVLPLVAGCQAHAPVTEGPMPPHTILLSAMMQDLSSQPGFADEVLRQLGVNQANTGKKGPALLTADLLTELRKRLLGRDWQGLDRFPGWTMREINPTVTLADDLVGKDSRLEGLSAVHPGSQAPALDPGTVRTFLDLGPYTVDRAETVSLAVPSALPGFTTDGIVSRITDTVTRGDGPNDLAPEHAASQRLADVLNRLAANSLDAAKPFRVQRLTASASQPRLSAASSQSDDSNQDTATPEALIADLLASGHSVSVTDSRYFANFGHLHFKGMDVMMPFWINTRYAVPHTGGLFRKPRPLFVPVSHAEYEWHIRGPLVNADVSHYFGVDGKAEWRTMDTLDQAWVLKRNAHTYTGAQAVEVTRLVGLITRAYMHQHARRPQLAFGGYYILGVCQDPVSAVELRLNGRSTLFPNTADSRLFDDPRDAEVNALFAAIPKDRSGARPPADRVFGSLPAAPGPDGRFAAITIPGLSGDLQSAYAAWQKNRLSPLHSDLFYLVRASLLAMASLLLCGLAIRRLRTRT